MKTTIKGLYLLGFCLITLGLNAQKSQLKIEIENFSLKAPETWNAQKTNTNREGFSIELSNNENQSTIGIHCIKKTINLESAIINQASITSKKQGFEDMIIEKVKSKKMNKKFSGKFLEYTNSPLRDYYRGGYYGIEDRGYTYIIEYYSLDLPLERKVIENIINTINILAPESRPNFFLIEKEFIPEVISMPEEEIEEEVHQEEEVIDTTNLSKKELKRLEKKSKKAKKDHFDIVIQEEEAKKKAEEENIKAEKKSKKSKKERRIEKEETKEVKVIDEEEKEGEKKGNFFQRIKNIF